MKLTQKNYYTKRNRYLTNSKVKDYQKSRAFFKRKHIDHAVDQKKTDAFLLGGMVDTLITEGEAKYFKKYEAVKTRSSKYEGKKTQVTLLMDQKAHDMANAMMTSLIFQELEEYERQVILQHDFKKSKKTNFSGIAGMLDFLYVAPDCGHAVIVDFKTSATIDPFKYHRSAISYQYDQQMAMYGWLVHLVYGVDLENITYRHVVMEKDTDGIYTIKPFTFDPLWIDETRERLMAIVDIINNQKDWEDAPVSMLTDSYFLTPYGN